MNNIETAQEIRRKIKEKLPLFAWATDECGYDQHIRFVKHRNQNWFGGSSKKWEAFCLDYADMLEKEEAEK